MNRRIVFAAVGIALLFATPALTIAPVGAVPASGLYAAFWKATFFGSPMAAWPACTTETTPPAGAPSSTAPTATEIDPNVAHGASTGFYWVESSTPGFGTGTGTGFTVGSTTFLNTAFSTEWTGYIYLSTGTTYYFQTTSDDGSWVYLNTTPASSTITSADLIVNNGGVHGPGSADSSGITVGSSGYYAIEVDYYETCDSQSGIDLSWSTGSPANFSVIPSTAFTPAQIGSNAPVTVSGVPQFALAAPLVAAFGLLAIALVKKRASPRIVPSA
ncbi:MAG: PA14 domain-containing protein [Nitrososphaerales archaeon]|jgi:hypothetical protein